MLDIAAEIGDAWQSHVCTWLAHGFPMLYFNLMISATYTSVCSTAGCPTAALTVCPGHSHTCETHFWKQDNQLGCRMYTLGQKRPMRSNSALRPGILDGSADHISACLSAIEYNNLCENFTSVALQDGQISSFLRGLLLSSLKRG